MEPPGKQQHRCPFCSYKCVTSQLQYHMRIHTREKPFVCDQCKQGFAFKQNLYVHIRRCHEGVRIQYKKIHKCSLCSYATHCKSHLEAHLPVHTGERSFPCQHEHCEFAAKTSVALRQHVIHRHENERKFACQVHKCSYRGNTRGALAKHSLKHSECRPFACDFEGCSYRAKNKTHLASHKRRVHVGGYKPLACSTCNYRTTTKTCLQKHGIVHMDEKPVKCNFSGCAFSCKTERNLKLHVLNHHTERTIKCDIAGCLFAAASRCKLEEHKKLVHYEKVHKCPHCDFRAANTSALRSHTDRHNYSLRFPCPRKGCTFQARHREVLYRHLGYHKANLGCSLEGCDYFATSRYALECHMRLHDPTGRPFHCPLCPKHFTRSDVLSVHLKGHTKEKPAKCPACSFSAATKHAIKLHVRSIHPTLFSKFDEGSICDHCGVQFDSTLSLAIHKVNLKTAVVMLTRLQIKFDSSISL